MQSANCMRSDIELKSDSSSSLVIPTSNEVNVEVGHRHLDFIK